MAKTTLILFVDVDEAMLPKGNAYTALPDQLYTAISETLPADALELSNLYLVNPKQNLEGVIRSMVLNYHHYAVNIRGEKCEEENCEQHPTQNVFSLHDHRQRGSSPPGVN